MKLPKEPFWPVGNDEDPAVAAFVDLQLDDDTSEADLLDSEAPLPFSQEDLLEALQGVGDLNVEEKEETNVLESFHDPSLDTFLKGELPEIVIPDSELPGAEDFRDIDQFFNEEDEDSVEDAISASAFESPTPSIVGSELENDLLDQLGGLQIGLSDQPESAEDPIMPTEVDNDLDAALFCMPCNESLEENFESMFGIAPLEQNPLEAELAKSLQPNANPIPDPIFHEELKTSLDKVRKEALEEAKDLALALGVDLEAEKSTVSPKSERMCLGHKERILGVHLSPCGKFLASASQDSTVRVWNVEKNRQVAIINAHSKKHECLRVVWASPTWGGAQIRRESEDQLTYMLATGGADGIVHVHGARHPEDRWELLTSIDHAELAHFAKTDDEEDKPQIYSLQFVDNWSCLPDDGNSLLLTSSDDHIHLWGLDRAKKVKQNDQIPSCTLLQASEILSLKFSDVHGIGYGVFLGSVTGKASLPSTLAQNSAQIEKQSRPFGGDRNPHNLVYVFDAAYCESNGLVGAALSDGTLRIVNGRGVCLTVLKLPGVNSHLTSFSWNEEGTEIASCVATGHVITWAINDIGNSEYRAECLGILEGGHEIGRPLFGTKYMGANLLLSWGVDGRLCLWDRKCVRELEAPIAILLHKADHPIYAVDGRPGTIALGGGGSEGGFMGIPLYLYGYSTDKKAEMKQAKSDNE